MTMIFLVNLSLGQASGYTQFSDSIAVQRVISQGGMVLFLRRNAEILFLS
jgi:hypothetical protein